MMRNLIRKILNEEIKNNRVVCDSCGWSWKLTDGGKDKYVCHKCGHDNTPKKSNLDTIIDKLSQDLHREKLDYEIEVIKKYIKDYITKSGFNVKFLPVCNTGYHGVRTRNEVIICSPNSYSNLGDFIYVIFHEIRHEQQVSKLKMPDALYDMDLDDFESLYKQYWEMELDADQFAKNKVTSLVGKLKIPTALTKPIFGLSETIKNYPLMSRAVEASIRNIVGYIKDMKKRGESYEGIQDHPIVKKYLDRLENLI